MSELIRREDAINAVEMFFEDAYIEDAEVHDLVYKINHIPTASPWHRVEEDPPDKKTYAIFYYEWTGISGTVYRETSIISLNELMALGCRPIAWMEKPKPPEESNGD